MMQKISLAVIGSLSLVIGACSINVDEGGYNTYQRRAHANAEALEDGRRIIIIEEAVRDSRRAADLVDTILDRARNRDCDTVSVDTRRRLYEIHDGNDVRGLRVVLSCPRNAELF